MKAVVSAQKQPLSVEMILHLHYLATDNAIDNNATPGKFTKTVKEQGYLFTAKEISTEYAIAENTARSDLKVLYDLSLLNSFKSGNSMIYIAHSNLLERLRNTN